MHYLKATINYGLTLSKQSSFKLHAYLDADWAGCLYDTGGFCIFLGQHLISWSSHKQHIVARSSTEAEYKSIANATVELIWLQTLLRELQFPLFHPPILWCDNLGATYLTSNSVYHSRTKHMAVDFHFVQDRVAAKALQVQFCHNNEQLANIFTKPLVFDKFSNLCSSLIVYDTPLDSRGRINIQKT